VAVLAAMSIRCAHHMNKMLSIAKKMVSDVDDIADGIGKVDISDKDSSRSAISSAIKQAELAEKEDQHHFLTSAQDEISSIYSKHRNRIDNDIKGMELYEPEMMNHPNFVLFKTKVYETINEEEIKNRQLFQDPPPKEDCPICMLPMPFCGELDGRVRFSYQYCCGKRVCTGCIDAARKEVRKGKMKDLCLFCRVPNSHSVEKVQEEDETKRCIRILCARGSVL